MELRFEPVNVFVFVFLHPTTRIHNSTQESITSKANASLIFEGSQGHVQTTLKNSRTGIKESEPTLEALEGGGLEVEVPGSQCSRCGIEHFG